MVMWIGVVIIAVTFALIIKGWESRAVLLVSGLLMCVLAGTADGVFDAFCGQLLSKSTTPVLTAAMAFSAVMEYTKCSSHLVQAILKPLSKVRNFLVPMCAAASCAVIFAVTSASGGAAAVGSLMIPTMIRLGIHPASAAATVLIGTWAGTLNPGNPNTAVVAEVAGVSVNEAWLANMAPGLTCAVVGIALLTAIDIFMGRGKKGEAVAITVAAAEAEDFKVNPIKAICPILPIGFILLGAFGILPNLSVAVWMAFGAVIGMIVDWKNPTGAIKTFFTAMGKSFGDIVLLLACAGVFTFGMESVGVTQALIDVMLNSTALARVTAIFLPAAIGALSGSGTAASAAFSMSILPYAPQLGFDMVTMGTAAKIAGALGRTMSPVAGCTIICARYGDVTPMDAVKRVIIPVIAMNLVLMLFFM